MKNILLVSDQQYGYQTDIFYWLKYLSDYFSITVFCYDQGLPKKYNSKVNINYITEKGTILKRLKLFNSIRLHCIDTQYSLIIVGYFPICFYFPLLFRNSISVLDIRTGKIHKVPFIRKCYNYLMKFESYFFKKITIINDSLLEELNINPYKAHIVPLGAEKLSETNKKFDFLNLLYVGKLSKYRHIYKTVLGLKYFIEKHPELENKILYHIVGDGVDYKNILQLISSHKLENVIKLYGWKTHDEISSLWDQCNYGVSFIPIKYGFSIQPPTKTYEYLKSGMAVIATNTLENKKLINDQNGVLIEDTAESFALGLEEIYFKESSFNSSCIRSTVNKNEWGLICKDLQTLLANFITEN